VADVCKTVIGEGQRDPKNVGWWAMDRRRDSMYHAHYTFSGCFYNVIGWQASAYGPIASQQALTQPAMTRIVNTLG